MPDIDPTRLAQTYFQHIRERNLSGMLSLFADDAHCLMPDGRSFSGPAAIREWFSKLFSMPPLSPKVLATIVGPSAIAAELENTLPDGTARYTANFFRLNASGRIQELAVYKRG